MSNATAIGAVTAVLARVIREAIEPYVSSPNVSVGRPEEPPGNQADRPRVNVFLYASRPNPSMRNLDLPHRSQRGVLVDQPKLALDLHYLLSFHGAESEMLPERLAGATLGALYREPVVSPDRIEMLLTDILVTDPTSFVSESDLADQFERIHISPIDLTIEEMTNLWSTFQAPYALSAAIELSVVVIEPAVEITSGPPVLGRGVFVVPAVRPTIDAIEPQLLEYAPTATLMLHGSDLGGDGMVVEFGEHRIPAPAAGPSRIRTSLPAGISAGVHAVRAIRTLAMGDPPRARDVAQSNAAVVMIRPVVSAPAFVAGPVPTIDIQVDPPVHADQVATLLITEASPPPDAVPASQQLEVVVRSETSSLSFGPVVVGAGDFLVRLRVDGAESALQLLPDGSLTGPVVTVP